MQAFTDSVAETPRCVFFKQGWKGPIFLCVNCGMVQEFSYCTPTSKNVGFESNPILIQENSKRDEQKREHP
jgi:CDGSH-type Zn-finger protein